MKQFCGYVDSGFVKKHVMNSLLVHFTEYGIRHVILLIVLGLVLYAWLITKHNFNQEQIDKRIRNSLPWLILLCFAIEGIFGMPIAIYVDVRMYSTAHQMVSRISNPPFFENCLTKTSTKYKKDSFRLDT